MTQAKARLISLVFLLLTGVALWQAQYFKIDASADTLLTKGNKLYLITQQASQTYNPEEFILIAYKPESSAIFSEPVLTFIDSLSAKIQEVERVKSVRSVVNVPIFAGMSSFSADIDPNALSWQQQRFSEEKMKYALTHHPLYEDLLFNKAQTALSMQVVFESNKELDKLNSELVAIETKMLERELTDEEQERAGDLRSQKEKIEEKLSVKRKQEIDQIREILNNASANGEFFLGGNNLLAYQMINIIKNDLVVFGAAILLIVSVLLLVLFRRLKWLVLPLTCCFVSVVFTLGLLGGLGIKVTVISANVVALQIILTLAVVIHIIVQYQEEVAKLKEASESLDQTEIVTRTIKEKLNPCFYAGLTTAIGFGSLIFSGIQPVITFGWMMVIALAVTLLVSLVLFPSLLIGFCRADTKHVTVKWLDTLMHGLASAVDKFPRGIIITSIVVAATGVGGCFLLTAENSFLNYFKSSTDVSRELTFIDKEFGGSTPFDILLTIPQSQRDPQLVVTAEAIQTLEAVQAKMAEKEAIGSITSIADFTRMASVVNKKPLVEYELSALYYALDKQLKDDLFGAYFAENKNEMRISMRVIDSTPGLNREQLVEQVHADMAAAGVDKANYKLSSLFILYQDIIARLMNSQIMTLAIVYLAMAVVLVFIFKSIKVALIALVPNVITTAAIMGFLGFAGIPLDLMTMTIAAVAMGISVDDTIHYVHRFQEEVANKSDNPVRSSHLSVGYALLYTTSIIVIGFVSLVFSDFVPSILFGLLTSLAMLLALITDISILPVLLKTYCSKAKPAKTQPA
ncbi:MMPL family transporter [Saccharophagus degradans]|uniref:efflux RND transporter permease subunit n=1 Tax=Saccharophagus degradans TaxID=86304 RepID=UPI001C0A4073|nr:MMPL family transporter [Saccharophagus degradans]MBU2983888.1 MMPL family transporter [Saccharophagus degradans]